MAAPQEWRRAHPPPLQRKAVELEGETGGAFAAYEESGGRMPEAMFGQHKSSSSSSSSSSRQQPRRHRRRGAPGLLACSRSSDEIQRTTANVALSPVTGPGATSFSSVASAFDFQHHIGSDPASELLVLKHILTRECLLSRLEAVCDHLRKRCQLLPAAAAATTSDGATAGLGESSESIVELLFKMRAATVGVIEAISVWRKDMTSHPPSAFVWHGDNYLLKITNDLNFLAGVQPLVTTLKMHPARFCRNPLMLPQTLDEQRRDGELHEEHGDDNNVSPGAGRRRHLYQAAQVLLDEESLESERDLLRQESTKSAGALPSRGDTSPELGGPHVFGAGGRGYGVRSCSTVPKGAPQDIDGGPASYSSSQFARGTGQAEDDDALRRRQRLSTWYEEARSQLVSLSTSPADEEYFLRSRRFWSKEELGETGGGCSPPAPHRRQPGTLLPRGGKRSTFTADSAVTGREAAGIEAPPQIGGTERLSDGEGSDRADLFSERLSSRHQRGSLPPPRRTRPSRGHPRSEGQEAHAAEGSARQAHGGNGRGERGGADVWSRPDRFGGGSSAALSCLTVDDIEQVLREVDPLPAMVAVCAAVVFLLSPEDQPPAEFLWPQGFEAVALPAEDFLWRLQEAAEGTATSTKARFLVPVLQREHLIPEVIERQGAHAVASLCAWALEELQVCEEFAEWSEAALEPWYETQLVPPQPGVPESNEVVGCEVRLIYKALHMLPNVGGSYVISLFEDKGGGGGFVVRAFDRAKRDAFWLSLAKTKVASFGENATRSPAALASTLARRLKLKPDAGTGKTRLVLPPSKKAESSSPDKKPKSTNTASSGRVKTSNDVGEQPVDRAEAEAGAGATPSASPSPSLPANEPATAAASEDPPEQAEPRPRRRRSHPPPVRGSTVEDLGPLVENEGDVSDCSAGELRDARPVPGAGDGKGAVIVADGRVVEQSEEGSAPAEISAKTEKAATASELAVGRPEQHVSQTTNASLPALALSEARATTTSGEVEREGLREGLLEPGMEESGSYAEDFTPDDDEDQGAAPGREVEARGEESGSYADDFADDGEETYEQDSGEEGRRKPQQGVEDQEAAGASAARSGVATATGSAEALTAIGSADVPASELAVEGLGGTDRRSDQSPPEIHAPRTSQPAAGQEGPLTEPRQSSAEGESADVGSSVERDVETELEEGYDDEFLEESAEKRESAEAEVPESTQPTIAINTKEPCPPQTEGCGRVDAESVADVVGHGTRVDSQGEPLAQDDGNVVQVSPLEPVSTLTVVDERGNTRRASAREDNLEAIAASKLAASKLASAAVAAALELVWERNEFGFPEVEAYDAPDTEAVEAERIVEEEAVSAGMAATAATAQNPPPTEQEKLVGEGAPFTDRTPSDDVFEGSFEDDTDEIDATRSAGDGTTAASCSEFSSFVGETDVPPSLSEQDNSEGPPDPGGIGGDQDEADGEVVEPTSAVEKAVHESSTPEYEGFEEDFDEEFEDDVEEDIPSGRPKEEREGVGFADSEILSGSERLETREPIDTATTASAGGEDPFEAPSSVEEVIGNQDEDRKGNEGRRNSVDVDQVAPVAGPSGDEVEDDFEEDDFEDP